MSKFKNLSRRWPFNPMKRISISLVSLVVATPQLLLKLRGLP